MERVLTSDERLKRAEQIYYQRRNINTNQNKKIVNMPVSKKNYLLKKMVIQIIICLLIYSTYFVVRNYDYFFSDEMINKTNQLLTYDINIQDIYCKIVNYVNNHYFNKNNLKENENNLEEVETVNEIIEDNNDVQVLDTLIVETMDNVVEVTEEAKAKEIQLSQMEIDANEIKKNYEFVCPLQGHITSRFGIREVTEKIVSPYHVGLDIAANTGTKFKASIDGTVVYSGELGGYGNCIQTQIEDVLVIYGHCSKIYVNKGDVITKGQEIGEVGETGNATGPHLHFEIRKDGRYVNPELVFNMKI